jgi:sulfur carrier protein
LPDVTSRRGSTGRRKLRRSGPSRAARKASSRFASTSGLEPNPFCGAVGWQRQEACSWPSGCEVFARLALRADVRVTANGQEFDVDERMTVAGFVRMRDLDPRYVVVERNGDPLSRDRYEVVVLEDGDRLELVRAVAGG